MKRHPPELDTFERLFERIHDEPKHAAHLTQKIACEVADSLGNHRRSISVCHRRQTFAHFAMRKRAKFSRAKTCLGECALVSASLSSSGRPLYDATIN